MRPSDRRAGRRPLARRKPCLRKWLLAFHLIGASKKGIASLQLSRQLGVTYKTAWHLSHRIRATMTDNSQRLVGVVETDETYIGGKRKNVGRGYRGNKVAVQTIVQRVKCDARGKKLSWRDRWLEKIVDLAGAGGRIP